MLDPVGIVLQIASVAALLATSGPPPVAARLAALEPDPPPANLSGGSHFVVSDERRHDVFRPAIADAGGMLIGVGTDQIYSLAAWARSEVVVALDFDQVVVDLHAVYALFIRAAATPDALVAWWEPARAPAVRALAAAGIPDPAARARALAAYDLSRELVAMKLARTRTVHARHRVRSWLDDQAQYDHVRALVRDGRLHAVRGDLTGAITMRQVGDLARSLGVSVRVLYLSNAEKYFPYTAQYRDNILGLPMDERSMVLRTVGWGPGDAARDDPFYIYVQQAGRDFRAWLEAPELPTARRIVRAKRRTATHGLYEVAGPRRHTGRSRRTTVAGLPPLARPAID